VPATNPVLSVLRSRIWTVLLLKPATAMSGRAAAVEATAGNRARVPGDGNRRALQGERAVALLQLDADRAGGVVRDGKILAPVGVEVGHRRVVRTGPDRERRARREREAGIPGQLVEHVDVAR